MKSILFISVAFLSGIDGFVMFAPYVVLVLSTLSLLRRRRPAAVPA